MAFFFHTVFLFFVCILEGTEEEKMETDTDSQQPEKVKSLWVPNNRKARGHAFHGVMIWV